MNGDRRHSTQADIVNYLKLNAQDVLGKTRDSLLPRESRPKSSLKRGTKTKDDLKIITEDSILDRSNIDAIKKERVSSLQFGEKISNPFAGDANLSVDGVDLASILY